MMIANLSKYKVFLPNLLFYLISLIIVTMVSYRVINVYTHVPYEVDAAHFANVGFHMLNGKVLYRDIWDHKQPVIHFLNYLALDFGGANVSSLRKMERIFAVLNAVLFFHICMYAFKNPLLCAFFSLCFLRFFYTPTIFYTGNLTEEYGTTFLLAATLALLFALHSEGKIKSFMVFLSGIFFSLTFFTKEPFLFSMLPVLLYFLFVSNENYRGKIRQIGILLFGSITIFFLLLLYFIRNYALIDWLDVFSYNIAYAKIYSKDRSIYQGLLLSLSNLLKTIFFLKTINLLFIAGVISAFKKEFIEKYKYLPILFLIWFAGSVIGANITKMYCSNYYLPAFAPFVLVSACGVMFVFDIINKYLNSKSLYAHIIVLTFLLTSLMVFDYKYMRSFYKRLCYNFIITEAKDVDGGSTLLYVYTNITDAVWIPLSERAAYLYSKRLSPTKYIQSMKHFYINTIKDTGKEKENTLLNELKKNPPKLILIYKRDSYMGQTPLETYKWIEANYKLLTDLGHCIILAKKP